MKSKFLEKLSKIYKDKFFKKKLNKIFFTLAAIVVFITSYTLILPAITVERDKARENNIPINDNKILAEEEKTKDTYKSEAIDFDMDKDKLNKKDRTDEEEVLGVGYEEKEEKSKTIVKDKVKAKKDKVEDEIILEKAIDKQRKDKEEVNKVNNSIEENISKENEEVISEEIKSKEEVQKEIPRRTLDFNYNQDGIVGRVKVINTNLPENALLKIKPIKNKKKESDIFLQDALMDHPSKEVSKLDLKNILKEDLPIDENLLTKKEDKAFRSNFVLDESQIIENKTKEIEEKIEGPIEEILFFDISFFTPEGEYLPVGDNATISFNISGENLSKSEDEEITVAHFGKDEMALLKPELDLDGNDKVEEITFNTEGFSVFAVIKHSTWTEARIADNEYSIITKLGKNDYVSANFEGKKLNSEILNMGDVSNRTSGLGTARPYVFKNTASGIKYDDFFIRKKSGNIYTIQDIKTGKYLTINNSEEATYQDD